MIYDPKNQGDQNHKECAELNEIRPCNHVITPFPHNVRLGAKEVFTPERIRGTAYRDTGSTIYKHTTAFDEMQHKTGTRPAMRYVPVFVFWG